MIRDSVELLGLVVVASLLGCAAQPKKKAPPAATASAVRTAPPACRGVRLATALDSLASALPRQQSLADALALRQVIRQGGLGGPRRTWQLLAFDCDWLHFIIAREIPRPARQAAAPQRKLHVRYEALRRVVVRRSAEAVRALGVGEVITMHEHGVAGVRVGMSAAEVARVAGRPLDVAYPAAAGCVQQRHRAVVVTICQDRVRSVSR